MEITKNKVVTLKYTLTDSEGVVIDKTGDDDVFAFIFGVGGIIPGLEAALEGKKADDAVTVEIQPEEGYGHRSEELVAEVPVDNFDGAGDIAEGMQFQTSGEDGAPRVVTVVKIEDGMVSVDGNHPLAGIVLNFDVNITDVRDATEEELEHGHVHGEGGHQH